MTGGQEGRVPAALLVAAGLLTVAAATAGSLRGAEPFATWYYPFAWYGVLATAEGAHRLWTGRWHLVARPGAALALFAWSVPFWLAFELVNFRMRNWYYVFVPAAAGARWSGIVLSFATVFPAILVSERLLDAGGAFAGRRSRPFPVTRGASFGLQGAGVALAALALAFPTWFFPFVWGSMTLLVDPWVWRRDPERSLLGRLAAGRPGLVLRLLAGGLAIGLLWESLNAAARGRWIYTVPGLEELKLFEMPVAGFLGFPVLALDGWAAWQALVLQGLAPGREGRSGVRPARALLAALPAVAVSAWVLVAMERYTITSTTPRLEGVAGEASGSLRGAGYDVFSLARAEPEAVARRTGLPPEEVARWVASARLAALRGIGTGHLAPLAGAGVRSVEELAAADPARLAAALASVPTVTPARVRVWVRGARRVVERGG